MQTRDLQHTVPLLLPFCPGFVPLSSSAFCSLSFIVFLVPRAGVQRLSPAAAIRDNKIASLVPEDNGFRDRVRVMPQARGDLFQQQTFVVQFLDAVGDLLVQGRVDMFLR